MHNSAGIECFLGGLGPDAHKECISIDIFKMCHFVLLWMSSVFWDMTACSLLKVTWHFTGTCLLHFQGCRVSQGRNWHEAGDMIYTSALKLEATCSSKMLVDFQWTAWHYVLEDGSIHNYCHENLRSCCECLFHKFN
jgi:hypothetical protein